MVIAFDIETTYHTGNLPWQKGARLICLSAVTSKGDKYTWIFDHPESTKTPRECIDEIRDIFGRASRIVAHNLKFDLHWLRYLGIDYSDCDLFCTMVAEYLISNHDKSTLDLESLSKKYGISDKQDKVKLYWESGYETDEISLRILQPYCEQDAINALALYYRQVPQIKGQGVQTLVSLENESLRLFEDMEWNGMRLDTEKLSRYSSEYGDRLVEIDRELSGALGIENPGSAQQLSAGLFGGSYKVDSTEEVEKILKGGRIKRYSRKCKVDKAVDGVGFKPDPEWELSTPGQYSTRIDNLQSLKCRTDEQRRIKELLLERSRVDQLKGTYFDGLSERVTEAGYVHPSINQTVTVTSRTSCSNPNLQNQPRGNTGPVKECFITRFEET